MKLWIVMLMVGLLVLSLLVTIIRNVNSSLNAKSYVPLERTCPDYWDVKDGWCQTSQNKLRPESSCITNNSAIDVEIESDENNPSRVLKMRPVINIDTKKDIAASCQLPWDGINYGSSPTIKNQNSSAISSNCASEPFSNFAEWEN